MSYGIQVYNANKILQIDGKYQNLFLLNKVDATVTSTSSINRKDINANYYIYKRLFKDTIIALRCNTSGAWVYLYDSVDNYPNEVKIQSIGLDGTVNFTIYEFGALTESINYTGKYGLRIYNQESKKLVFDSRKRPMRVVKSVYYSASDNETLEYNSDYAIAICEGCTSLLIAGGPTVGGMFVYSASVFTGGIKKESDSKITVGNVQTYSNTFNGPSNGGVGGTVAILYGFIVDVSGY